MTVKYRIQQYLEEEGSFAAGVGLLEMAGSHLATRHRSVLNKPYVGQQDKARLRADLVRVVSQLPEDTGPPTPIQGLREKPEDTPRITALRTQARQLHKVRSDLKGRLLQMALDNPEGYSDEDRHTIVVSIMEENVRSLDTIYAQIRRFEDEGIEPADDEALIRQKTVEQMKEVLNLRPQLSRLRKRKNKGEDVTDEIAEKSRRLAELEQLLGL